MSLIQVDVNALIRLKASRNHLTNQQYKTLRGQVFTGDHAGAMKGLEKLLARAGQQK